MPATTLQAAPVGSPTPAAPAAAAPVEAGKAARQRTVGPARRGSMLARALVNVRAGITAAALTLLLGSVATAVLTDPAPPTRDHFDLSTNRVDRMFERHRCSVTGFAPDVIPARAMVRTADGPPRMTSFDEGWRIFSGEARGELMAVCLGPEPRVR